MQAKLIRLDEVIDVTGLSRSHLYYLISQGLFPDKLIFAAEELWRGLNLRLKNGSTSGSQNLEMEVKYEPP